MSHRQKTQQQKPKNTLTGDTLFTDFITGAEDKTTINSARSMVENKTSVAKFIKDWKEQHNTIVRYKNKENKRKTWKRDGKDTSYCHPENKRIQI